MRAETILLPGEQLEELPAEHIDYVQS